MMTVEPLSAVLMMMLLLLQRLVRAECSLLDRLNLILLLVLSLLSSASRVPLKWLNLVSLVRELVEEVFFLKRKYPSGWGWVIVGLTQFLSLFANLLKSDKILKLLTSLAVGMNDNPLDSKRISGLKSSYPERFKIKLLAQLIQFLI